MSGKVVHFTVPVDEPQRAITFYQQVFDWHVSESGPPGYWSVQSDPGEGIDGGLCWRSDDDPTPIVYVQVDDIRAALTRTVASGGDVIGDRMPIPGTGWMARIRDPEGNIIGLFQGDQTAEPAG
jgi:predicted enzyme related to lactoylglutathione lyase